MSRVVPSRVPRPSWPALAWLGVLVTALVLGVVLAVNSDAANTDARVAADPPDRPTRPLAAQLDELWSAQSLVDDQRTIADDTVILASERGVRGLDPSTGQERWHYLRSNATMCDLTVLDDVVVALFRTTGRCNEAVALEAGSGLRRWYRNVGFSDELSMLGSGTAAVAVTPEGLAVLDAVGNSLRWRYNPPQGCELASVAVGTDGVVVLESCTTGTRWLAAFELYSGEQQWRVAPPEGDVTVLGADGVISLLVEEQLTILSARNGTLLSALPVAAGSSDSSDSAATISAGPDGGRGVPLVYLAGRLYAVDPTTGAQLWIVAAEGLPANSDLGVVVPEAGAFVTRNPATGQEISRSVLDGDQGAPDPVSGGLARIEQAGSTLLAVSPDGVVAYG